MIIKNHALSIAQDKNNGEETILFLIFRITKDIASTKVEETVF
jgi:hypothetical protein